MTQLAEQRTRALAPSNRHLRYLPVTALLLDLFMISGVMVLAAWCVLSLPVALVVGRAFRSGQQSHVDAAFAEIVRRYEAADVSATDSTRAS